MMDTAAAFLFTGLTSSKVSRYPRDRHAHTEDLLSSTTSTCNTLRSDVTARFSSSSSTGKDWHSVVKSQCLWISQALVWPPPVWIPLTHPIVLSSPAGPVRCLLQTVPRLLHTCGSPKIPTWTLLTSYPCEVPEPLTGKFSLRIVSQCTGYLMHTPQFLNGPSISMWRFLALSLYIPCLTVCVPVLLFITTPVR